MIYHSDTDMYKCTPIKDTENDTNSEETKERWNQQQYSVYMWLV